jgi:hypothetical protein
MLVASALRPPGEPVCIADISAGSYDVARWLRRDVVLQVSSSTGGSGSQLRA